MRFSFVKVNIPHDLGNRGIENARNWDGADVAFPSADNGANVIGGLPWKQKKWNLVHKLRLLTIFIAGAEGGPVIDPSAVQKKFLEFSGHTRACWPTVCAREVPDNSTRPSPILPRIKAGRAHRSAAIGL